MPRAKDGSMRLVKRARIKWLEGENAQLRERLDRAKRGM